jgi:hypothetical protein
MPPGGGHRFYEDAALFEKYEMSLLGPPLTAD